MAARKTWYERIGDIDFPVWTPHTAGETLAVLVAMNQAIVIPTRTLNWGQRGELDTAESKRVWAKIRSAWKAEKIPVVRGLGKLWFIGSPP